jgi:D-sedoheptulose 7-phosphate isomerase
MLGVQLDIQQYLKRLHGELDRVDLAESVQLSDLIYTAWQEGRTVFVVGNGGSACTASHMCEDLGKSSLRQADLKDESKRRLKILSLTDNVGWITALGNDCGYDQIFVQQLMNFGQPGDVLVAISGSGNSPNVLAAVDWANRHGLKTFGMTGYTGGKLREMQQAGFHVPLDDMGMVESIHVCLLHWVVDDVFARINREGRYAA